MKELKTPPNDRARVDKYRLTHKDKINARNRKNYNTEKGKAYYCQRYLREKYGITILEKMLLLEKQGGRCAICGTDEFNGKSPCVDHDHTTGKIRGILCGNCNNALGLIKDNVLIAQQMIVYLGGNHGKQ